MPSVDTEALAVRYAQVKARVPGHVLLIAVSKTRSVAEIQALYDLGHRDFGENYPQELRDKQPQLPSDIRWHFVGHLQTNKVKYIAPFVHLVHAVDSTGLLDELDKRAKANGRCIDVLLQLHVAQEESKHGLDEAAINALLTLQKDAHWQHLRFRGLMGMATFTDDREQIRAEFGRLAHHYRLLRNGPWVDPDAFAELSMGMSDDMDLAISEGSTMVRVGTSLFGPRG